MHFVVSNERIRQKEVFSQRASEGHFSPPAPSAVRSHVPRRRGHPFGALGRSPRPAAEGVYGTSKGWTRRQPSQVPPSAIEAKYLGFRVRLGLIKPQERKVEAVRAAPRPSTKTQVRAFLGLAGYYRCFIPNFSSLAAPLTDLTRKGQPECVIWGPEAEKAFQRIKSALTEEPVLCAPDFGCPFLLQTDASETGLGAVLSQVQEGEEHPILFISRKLTPAEKELRDSRERGSGHRMGSPGAAVPSSGPEVYAPDGPRAPPMDG